MESLSKFKTSTLCFTKEDFDVKDFSVDKFVSDCRKYVSLETMLEDLGLYHKVLCCSLFEFINKDYADFVNLSSNLIGLDKSLKSIVFPTENIMKEIKGTKIGFDELLTSCKSLFADHNDARQSKMFVSHLFCLLEGLKKIENLNAKDREKTDSKNGEQKMCYESLERTALEFNLCQYHLLKIRKEEKENSTLDLSSSININEIEAMSGDIQFRLEQFFLESLSKKDAYSLKKILHVYSVINREDEVLYSFAKIIVKPHMQKYVTQEEVIKHGLRKVLENVLLFIRCECTLILSCVPPGYDILVQAIWPEFISCFDLIASVYTYAPGNPELFFENYSAMLLFLEDFEQCCASQSIVKKLRSGKAYQNFINKWNIRVYFKIRFQEIAGKFEKSLFASDFVKSERENGKYLLDVTNALDEALNSCWNSKVFLSFGLSASFFRLTMELISRFRIFVQKFLDNYNCQEMHLPIDVALIVHDVEKLIKELNYFFPEVVCLKIKSSKVIEAAFENSLSAVKDTIPLAKEVILKSLIYQCCSPLKMITDIPRLYRKTNREVPSKPSAYVSQIFVPINDFLQKTKDILDEELRGFFVKLLTEEIIGNCVVLVRDLLVSIKKIEDSLKILKRGRDTSHRDQGTKVLTDDEKIRRQLSVDISSLEEMVQKLGVNVKDLRSSNQLKELLDICTKNEKL